MEIIEDKGLYPTTEVEFEFNPHVEEVDEEVYRDIKEDPDVDFLQESSSEEEEEDDAESESESDSHSHSSEEEEKVVEETVEYEEMDLEFGLEFAKKLLKGLWKYEKEECKDHEDIYYKRYAFIPVSTWEEQIMRNEIIFTSKISDPFLIQLSLYLFQFVVDRKIEMIEKIREDIITEVIDWKRINKLFQKSYAKIEKKQFHQLAMLIQISRKDLVQMIYDTGIFETHDFYSFEKNEELGRFVEKTEDVSGDFHQIPIIGCRIVNLKDMISFCE